MKDQFFTHQTQIKGLQVNYVESGDLKLPSLFLFHGWPDLWITWKKLMNSLKPFFHIIALEMTGYGENSPSELKYYTTKFQCELVVELMNSLEIQKSIFVGHDWGGYLAWRMGIYFPEKCIGIASYCTGYTPPSKRYYSMKEISKIVPSLKYQQYIEENKEEVTKYFNENIELVLNCIFRKHDENGMTMEPSGKLKFEPMKKTDLLNQEDYDFYMNSFKKIGFSKCFNWYLTRKLNWEDELSYLNSKTLKMPCLIVTAGMDTALRPEMTLGMEKFIPKLTRSNIEKSSHWILHEHPEECSLILLNWLKSIFVSKL
jgi:soluble epoxide hydrolase / lipid-phosphate phosphatase